MNEWMSHPLLSNMEPIKMELLHRAASQVAGKSGKDLAPVMMSLITSANRQGIRFSPEEMNLILDILKEGKSPEEQARIDQTLMMVRSFMQRKM